MSSIKLINKVGLINVESKILKFKRNVSYSSVKFLKPFVHPHFHSKSFSDQRHLKFWAKNIRGVLLLSNSLCRSITKNNFCFKLKWSNVQSEKIEFLPDELRILPSKTFRVFVPPFDPTSKIIIFVYLAVYCNVKTFSSTPKKILIYVQDNLGYALEWRYL